MFAVDGNFKAVHDRQKRPEDDVFLSDGLSFFTERETFKKHLAVALETYDVRSFNQYICYEALIQYCAERRL
jgi:hypothetical protein